MKSNVALKLAVVGAVNALVFGFVPLSLTLLLEIFSDPPSLFAIYLEWFLMLFITALAGFITALSVIKIMESCSKTVKVFCVIIPFLGWLATTALYLFTELWWLYGLFVLPHSAGSLFGDWDLLTYLFIMALDGITILVFSIIAYVIYRVRLRKRGEKPVQTKATFQNPVTSKYHPCSKPSVLGAANAFIGGFLPFIITLLKIFTDGIHYSDVAYEMELFLNLIILGIAAYVNYKLIKVWINEYRGSELKFGMFSFGAWFAVALIICLLSLFPRHFVSQFMWLEYFILLLLNGFMLLAVMVIAIKYFAPITEVVKQSDIKDGRAK